jgi:diguanylate cyclase (GGDEF)-like protein
VPPWSVFLARLVIVLATALAAILLVHRWRGRGWTCWAITGVLLLSVVPTLMEVAQAVGGWDLGNPLRMLRGLGEPSFAILLFAVLLGLRSVSGATANLRRQNRTLQRAASLDFLTGLPNRRRAQLLLDFGVARARRNGEPLGFIMMDLDHFKKVNDRHGHQAGDAVLAHVGSLLKNRLRDSDIVARYGGEEFLIAVPQPEGDGVLALAEDIRARIAQNPAEFDGRKIPITASFGVAVIQVRGERPVDEGIKKSDTALYMAKSLGRNRVICWEHVCRETDESANHAAPAPAGEPLVARAAR